MTTITISKKIIIALIIGLFIGGGVTFLIMNNQNNIQGVIAPEEAGKKIINIINERIQQQQGNEEIIASLVSVISERGLYKITVNVQEEESSIYLTKDGFLLFPEAINLDILLATPPPPQQEEQQQAEIQSEYSQEQLTNLAKCLTEKGVRFFGTYTCPWCIKQKEIFGEASKYLTYIECAGDRATEEELALCQEFNIAGVPDWRFPDGTQQPGMQTIQRLAELSACPL